MPCSLEETCPSYCKLRQSLVSLLSHLQPHGSGHGVKPRTHYSHLESAFVVHLQYVGCQRWAGFPLTVWLVHEHLQHHLSWGQSHQHTGSISVFTACGRHIWYLFNWLLVVATSNNGLDDTMRVSVPNVVSSAAASHRILKLLSSLQQQIFAGRPQ